MNNKRDFPIGLVNKSTSWLVEDACFGSTIPTSYFSCHENPLQYILSTHENKILYNLNS